MSTVISGPARSKLGIRSGTFSRLLHAIDWYPTLLAIAGLEPGSYRNPNPDKPIHGMNQLEALKEPDLKVTEDTIGATQDQRRETEDGTEAKVGHRPPNPMVYENHRKELFLGYSIKYRNGFHGCADRRENLKLYYDTKTGLKYLYDVARDVSERDNLASLMPNTTDFLYLRMQALQRHHAFTTEQVNDPTTMARGCPSGVSEQLKIKQLHGRTPWGANAWTPWCT